MQIRDPHGFVIKEAAIPWRKTLRKSGHLTQEDLRLKSSALGFSVNSLSESRNARHGTEAT
jgi:hypothetical protein